MALRKCLLKHRTKTFGFENNFLFLNRFLELSHS